MTFELTATTQSGREITWVYDDYQDQEGWQNFHILLDCPELCRSSPDKEDWRTREEIKRDQAKQVQS